MFGIFGEYDFKGNLIRDKIIDAHEDLEIGEVIVLKQSLIYQTYRQKTTDKFNHYRTNIGSLSFDLQKHEPFRISTNNNFQRYWAFRDSQMVCYSEEQSQQKEGYSIKLNYEKKFAFGATFMGQQKIVGCQQLDSVSKMGWITKDKYENVFLYILSDCKGVPKLQKIEVSFKFQQHESGHFWHPIWQLFQNEQKTIYFMAHQRITSEDKYKKQIEVVKYCICDIVNGKIIMQRIVLMPKSQPKFKIRHQRAVMLEGNVIYLKYLKQTSDNGNRHDQKLLDLSRNTLAKVNIVPKKYYTMTCVNSGGKEVIVADRHPLDVYVSAEESQWMIIGRVIFTSMAIRDVYMLLLLHLNEDFDDDLLCDTMNLICE